MYNITEYSKRPFDTAHLALPILIEQAKANTVINYGELNRLTNGNRSWTGKSLNIIHDVVKRLYAPKINHLAVRQDTQLPSEECGMNRIALGKLRGTCMSVNWDILGPQLIAELTLLTRECGH